MKIKKFISQSPIFALYLGNALLIEPFQAQLAKEGIHFLQGLILTALFFETREVRPYELAKVFQVSKSNLSHALRDLEKKGMLKRSVHPDDARGYLFCLTPLGNKKALGLVKTFDDVENALEKNVSGKATKEFINVINQYVDGYHSKFPKQSIAKWLAGS